VNTFLENAKRLWNAPVHGSGRYAVLEVGPTGGKIQSVWLHSDKNDADAIARTSRNYRRFDLDLPLPPCSLKRDDAEDQKWERNYDRQRKA
jgi:hypothetical protein